MGWVKSTELVLQLDVYVYDIEMYIMTTMQDFHALLSCLPLLRRGLSPLFGLATASYHMKFTVAQLPVANVEVRCHTRTTHSEH